MPDSDTSVSSFGWDAYWQGAAATAAFAYGGVAHPGITAFWDKALAEILVNRIDPKILDIATGSGSLIAGLKQRHRVSLENVTCVDIARAAIEGVTKRFPGVTGVVADAKNIPLDSRQYDVVISQFGIEYSGPAAINEAVRLVAPGGCLLFLMHIRSGGIYKECAAARKAIEKVQRCGFIPRSRALFETGFAAIRGADRRPYEQAALELNPAIRQLESILSEHGEHVAGDTIVKLYDDVRRIHSRMQYYEPGEIFRWLDTMERELVEFERRMTSMHNAALDGAMFDKICSAVRGENFRILKGESLVFEGERLPVAYVLCASRDG